MVPTAPNFWLLYFFLTACRLDFVDKIVDISCRHARSELSVYCVYLYRVGLWKRFWVGRAGGAFLGVSRAAWERRRRKIGKAGDVAGHVGGRPGRGRQG